MNGVEILSSETIYNGIIPAWCVALGLFLTIIFAALFVLSIELDNLAITAACLILMFASFFLIISCAIPSKNSIDHIEYKVTIDDSVSMNEFLDKYEILDQEGKIYTVRERK